MAAEQATTIQVNVNAQPFTDGLKSATAAAQQFETQIDNLSSVTQKTAQAITATASGFAAFQRSIDPAARSAQGFASDIRKIQSYYTGGFLKSQQDVNAALDLSAAKWKQSGQAAADARVQLAQALNLPAPPTTTAAAPASGTANSQATNATLDQTSAAYNKLGVAATNAGTAENNAAKIVQQQAAAFKSLEAQLDPAIAKKQTLAAVEKTLNDAVASGQTTQTRANTLMQSATKLYGDFGGAAKITGQQLVIAGDQIRQMSDQMISGGGFVRPILMQVPVAVQVLGGFSNTIGLLKDNIGKIISYGGLAAMAAALYLVGNAAETSQKALLDLSNGLSKYGGDYAGTAATISAAARDLAATTSLGTQESRDAMATLAAAPGFTKTKQNFEDTLKVAQTFSVGFGETLAQAASRINSIFADPFAAALQYADQSIQGFDGQFIAHIQLLVNSGQKVQAVNEVYDKLRQAFTNVNTAGTPLQAALRGLSEAFTAVGNGAGGASGGIGTGLTNALAGAINAVTSLVKGIDSLLDGMSKIGISGSTQGGILLGAFALMLPPVQKLIGLVISLVSWLSKIGPAAEAAAAATTAATAAEAGVAGAGAAVAGVGAAGAGAAAAEGVGAAAFLASIPIAAIVAAVLALGGTLIWAWIKNSGAQGDFQSQALAAGFQKYDAGGAQLPRYMNTRTGEDLSTEQMQQRLNGQALADSFGTRLDQWFAAHAPTWLGGQGGTIQQLGAQPQPGTLTLKPLTTLPPAGQPYAPMFTAAEQKYGLPPGLLAGIANIETGGTYDPNAANKTSSARGMMQILEGTATNPGYGITPIKPEDRNNPAIAIDFAGQLLAKVAAANGGSLAAAVKLYSGGGYQLDPSIAGVKVGAPTTAAPPVATTGPASGPTTAQQDITKILYGKGPGQGLADLTGLGNAGTADAIQHNIAQLEALKTSAGATADQIDGLNKVEEQQRAALENLKTPFQKTVEQQQQQLALDTELNPATKQVIQAQQQLIDSNRQLGKDPPTAAELAAVRSGVLNQLSAQYNGVVAATNQEAAATNAVAAAWDKGAIAADHATNVAKAYQQIVGASPNPTVAQLAAVQRLTDAYDKQSAALEKVAAKQSVYNSGQQLKVLNAQEGALGTSATNQAVVAAQAQKAAEFKDPTTPEAQQAIQAAGQVAAKTVNVDREKQAWASVDQAATSAIDDIGSGLEDVLSTGKWTGFADAAKKALGDISKELLNLALLNPLKNLLTGGRANAPSLFDLFNGTGNGNNPLSNGGVLSGGQVSGGSGGSGSGIGSIISSIGSLFGKGSGTGLLTGIGNLFSGLSFDGMAAGSTLTALTTEAATNAAAFGSLGAVGGIVALHTGGFAGQIGGTHHSVPMSAFAGAARYHSGGVANDNMNDTLPPQFASDEIPAILRRNELVLTQAQQRAVANRIGQTNRQPIINQHFNISTPDADSFRASKSQVKVEMARALAAASRRM